MPTTAQHATDAVSAEEAAARMRAARAFAALSQAQVAHVLDVSTVTVKRIERGTRPCTLDELFAVADACGVPREFMTDGFGASDLGATVEVVRAAVEAGVQGMHSRFDNLEATLSRTAAEAIADYASGAVEDRRVGGRN